MLREDTLQASLKRKHRQVRLQLQRSWHAVAQRLDRWLPAASLQTYLVAMILLATVPIALLLTWKVAVEARSGRQSAVALLQQSAASVAQAAEHPHNVARGTYVRTAGAGFDVAPAPRFLPLDGNAG